MSPELVKALTDLVNAISDLARITGTGVLAFVVLGLAAMLVGIPWLREHLRNKRIDIVIQHKEKEVERLAEDNRRYREVYLARLGVPSELMKHDSADSQSAKAGASGGQSERGKKQ